MFIKNKILYLFISSFVILTFYFLFQNFYLDFTTFVTCEPSDNSINEVPEDNSNTGDKYKLLKKILIGTLVVGTGALLIYFIFFTGKGGVKDVSLKDVIPEKLSSSSSSASLNSQTSNVLLTQNETPSVNIHQNPMEGVVLSNMESNQNLPQKINFENVNIEQTIESTLNVDITNNNPIEVMVPSNMESKLNDVPNVIEVVYVSPVRSRSSSNSSIESSPDLQLNNDNIENLITKIENFHKVDLSNIDTFITNTNEVLDKLNVPQSNLDLSSVSSSNTSTQIIVENVSEVAENVSNNMLESVIQPNILETKIELNVSNLPEVADSVLLEKFNLPIIPGQINLKLPIYKNVNLQEFINSQLVSKIPSTGTVSKETQEQSFEKIIEIISNF